MVLLSTNPDADYDKIKKTLTTEIERYFRPEFINRLDDIIVFRPLDRKDLYTVVDFELAKVFKRLEEREMTLELDEKAKEFLIDKGYNPDFGARPLRRAIGQFIEDPLAESILRGDIHEGHVIRVTHEDEKDYLSFDAVDKPADSDEGDDDGDDGPRAGPMRRSPRRVRSRLDPGSRADRDAPLRPDNTLTAKKHAISRVFWCALS